MTPSRRAAWPFLLLTLCLGVMITSAVVAYRAVREHRATTRQLLGDYASFAAWSYTRYLSESLGEATWQIVNPILHRQAHASPRMPDATNLIDYRDRSLRDCRCDPGYQPELYFSYRLSHDDVVSTAGATPAPARTSALVDGLDRVFNERGRLERLGVLQLSLPEPVLVGYGLMPTIMGDTMLYGFTFDSTSLAAGFRRARSLGALLPATLTRGRPDSTLVALQVRDASSRVLYQDPDWNWENPVRQQELEEARGGLTVAATIIPDAAAWLDAGSLPPWSIAVLILATALAALLAIVALLQLRREGELTRLRSDFVAGVSHELRTPLAQLRLYLDTLRLGRYETDEQREWLVGHLTRETTRLEQLVENVLTFTRLERAGPDGSASPAPAPTDLGQELEAVVATFGPLAASRGASLSARMAPDVWAEVDPPRFRQVLLNLLDNAVKFGPRGQVVRLHLEAEGDECVLSVTDEGPGVPEAEWESIWSPYFRGGGAAARAAGGSGIGLALVKQAVESLHGRTWVERSAGGGARFVVALPRLPAPVPPTADLPS